MNGKINDQVSYLAYHLWTSAGHEYGRALEFWMMAEQMVWELAVASARISGSAVEVGAAIERTAPARAANYVQQIRELAYYMWEAAGAQCGHALDYWLAAERHMTTIMVVSGTMAESSAELPDAGQSAQSERDRFAPDAYLNEIRTHAYYMWENAGREHDGDHLGFWLAAEQQALHRMEAAARAKFCAFDPVTHGVRPRSSQPETDGPETWRSETWGPTTSGACLAPEGDGPTMMPVKKHSPLHIRRLEPAQGLRTY